MREHNENGITTEAVGAVIGGTVGTGAAFAGSAAAV